jgi:type IV pilus assembly protein PilM
MRRSLGLEIGAAALRWVELAEERGRTVIRDSGIVPLADAGERAVAEAVRALVAARRLRGREVVASVPRAAVTLRWLSLPAATRDETAGMVELEAGQSLPFPVEEAALDFAALPAADGRQQVLLAAARRGLVQERRRALEAAGLRVGAVSVDALAMAAVARVAVPDADQGALLIHRDGQSATFSSVEGERLCLSRSVTLEPADAESLATEARRTLLAGGMAGGGAAVRAIWLTGEGATEAAAALADVLARETAGPAPVAVLPRSPFAGEADLAPELDTALGLALLGLRPAAERLDLARQVRPVTTSGASQRRSSSLLAGLGVSAVAAAVLLLLPSSGDRELAAAAARARSDVRQLAERRSQLVERARILHGAVAPAHSYLDVLNDVSALAGPDIWLTQFTYDRGRPIVIRGAARSRAAVARLVEGLRNSGHLERVVLGTVTQSAQEKGNTVQFTVNGVLRADAPLQARRRGVAQRRVGAL